MLCVLTLNNHNSNEWHRNQTPDIDKQRGPRLVFRKAIPLLGRQSVQIAVKDNEPAEQSAPQIEINCKQE